MLAIVVLAWRLWPSSVRAPVVTAKRQVTFVGNVENSAISPDGRFLAYAAHNDDSLFVFVQELAGGNAIPIAVLEHADIETLRWSPDGSRLLVTGVAGTTAVAYVVPRLGGDRRTLPVASLLNDLVPLGAWMPDGEHVAVWSRTLHGVFRAMRIDVRNGDTASLPLVKLPFTFQGSWSPSGGQLAIGQASESTYDVWIIRPDGTQTRIASASTVTD